MYYLLLITLTRHRREQHLCRHGVKDAIQITAGGKDTLITDYG